MERDLDLAWLAGIVDGEGCLMFTKSTFHGRKNPGYSALLKIGMYHEETMNRVGRITETKVRPHPNYDKTVWEVSVQGSERLAKLLNELLPHLTTKRQEALYLLEAIALCPPVVNIEGYQGRRYLTEEELAMREGFYRVLREAKAS